MVRAAAGVARASQAVRGPSPSVAVFSSRAIHPRSSIIEQTRCSVLLGAPVSRASSDRLERAVTVKRVEYVEHGRDTR